MKCIVNKMIIFLGCALMNPLYMLAGIYLAEKIGLLESCGSNETRLAAGMVVVYVMLIWSMAIAGVGIGYWITKCIRQPVGLGDFLDSSIRAHLMFAPFLLYLLFLINGMEGNIVGFVLLPIAGVLLVVTIPLAIGLFLKRLKQSVKAPASKQEKKAYWGTVAIIVMLVAVLAWQHGPYTKLAAWFSWRQDTPYYALQHASTAMKQRDVKEFLQVVDLDAVLDDWGIRAEQPEIRESLLREIAEGSLLLSNDPEKPPFSGYGWAIGGGQRNDWDVDDIAAMKRVEGKPQYLTTILSLANGEKNSLVWRFTTKNGKCKIVGISNVGELIKWRELQKEELGRNVKMVDVAKEKSSEYLQYTMGELTKVNAPDDYTIGVVREKFGNGGVHTSFVGEVSSSAHVVNCSGREIVGIKAAGIIREVKTRQVIAIHSFVTNFNVLPDGGARDLLLRDDLNYVLTHHLANGNYSYETIPLAILLKDGQTIEWAKK